MKKDEKNEKDSPQLQSPLLEDKNEQKEDQSHQSLSCQSHDCTKTAQFCYEDEAAARYCSDHKLEGMIRYVVSALPEICPGSEPQSFRG